MWTVMFSQARGGGRVSDWKQTTEDLTVPLKGVEKVSEEVSRVQKAMVTTKAEGV